MKKLLILIAAFTIFFSGCRRKEESTYMAEIKNAVANKDIKATIETSEKFIKAFPQGVNTAQVMYDLGGIYDQGMDSSKTASLSDSLAVEQFHQLVQQFPTSPLAPKAAFQMGFILENDLKQFDNAKAAYRNYIKAFPNHEMVKDAQFEIDNMGKPLEDIINQAQNSK